LAVPGPQFLLEGPEPFHALHPLAEPDFPFGGLSDNAGPFPRRDESPDFFPQGAREDEGDTDGIVHTYL